MFFSGDGQEQKDEKVDDDEDRRNPQYIPKKGMFYEHDDRIESGDEETAKEGGLESEKGDADKPRRVPRSETVEKWGHDKFLDRDQVPKSKEELVTAYGYDIRNVENAPRACSSMGGAGQGGGYGNTYGLSPQFLENLGIDGPLHTR